MANTPSLGRYLEKEEIESLLEEAKEVVLCSHNRDGTIHATPVWYKYMDGKIVIITQSSSRKGRNVKRDRNVSLLFVGDKPTRIVLIYGEAELEHDNLLSTSITLCEKYMSREKAESLSEKALKDGLDLVIRVKPKNIVAINPP